MKFFCVKSIQDWRSPTRFTAVNVLHCVRYLHQSPVILRFESCKKYYDYRSVV